jgi:hypothetical protein
LKNSDKLIAVWLRNTASAEAAALRVEIAALASCEISGGARSAELQPRIRLLAAELAQVQWLAKTFVSSWALRRP